MSKNYTEYTKNLNVELAKIRQEIPEVMSGFSQMAAGALKPGALDKKTKELIGMALAVGNRCGGCIGFHAQSLVKLEASREEFMEMLGMAIYMGGGPSLMYAAEALSAFEEFSKN
jgi:AhpD family alkylhydroperoxidase